MCWYGEWSWPVDLPLPQLFLCLCLTLALNLSSSQPNLLVCIIINYPTLTETDSLCIIIYITCTPLHSVYTHAVGMLYQSVVIRRILYACVHTCIGHSILSSNNQFLSPQPYTLAHSHSHVYTELPSRMLLDAAVQRVLSEHSYAQLPLNKRYCMTHWCLFLYVNINTQLASVQVVPAFLCF